MRQCQCQCDRSSRAVPHGMLRSLAVTVLLSCLSVCAVSEVEDALRKEVHGLLMGEGQKEAVPWASLCPPPVLPLRHSACNVATCSANSDCHQHDNCTYLCCFNGCVDTCMCALDPHPVFDWIEDLPESRNLIVPGRVVSHSSPPEMVALPGGCVITPSQFLSLEHFKQNQHVSECFCDVGGVFCKIVQ